MIDDVTKSQRATQIVAAKIANKTIKMELKNPSSPITQALGEPAPWWASWNPFVPNHYAEFGLRLRDSDALVLVSGSAMDRVEQIVQESMLEAMQISTSWIGPMINDLLSGKPSYKIDA